MGKAPWGVAECWRRLNGLHLHLRYCGSVRGGLKLQLPVVRLPVGGNIGLTTFCKLHIHNESHWQIFTALSTRDASDSIITPHCKFCQLSFSQELHLTVGKEASLLGSTQHFLWFSRPFSLCLQTHVRVSLPHSLSFGQHQSGIHPSESGPWHFAFLEGLTSKMISGLLNVIGGAITTDHP